MCFNWQEQCLFWKEYGVFVKDNTKEAWVGSWERDSEREAGYKLEKTEGCGVVKWDKQENSGWVEELNKAECVTEERQEPDCEQQVRDTKRSFKLTTRSQ